MSTSILLYKQRHRNPNFKDTAGANYAHIRYIATRSGVLKNQNGNHGLFGKMEPGTIQEFSDWREIAKIAYANSKKRIVMYRSVVSFAEESAKELLLQNQKSWQRYIENHIMTIAEKNGIRREHLQWAAAVHGTKGHPHIHVVFWDTSVRAKNPFVKPEIPDAIRKQMIKDTFAEKILAWAKQKDEAAKSMRRITDALVEQFESELRRENLGRYQAAEKMLEDELEQSVSCPPEVLAELAERLFDLKESVPEKGRIAYQLLPKECRNKTDEAVIFLLAEVPEIRKCFERYVDVKCRMAGLYATDGAWLKEQKEKFEKEAGKILANRILSGVRAVYRIESEERVAAYMQKRREYLTYSIITEALAMLSQAAYRQENEYDRSQGMTGEMSKEARKELFLKNQDRGYEH